ncbi:MAG: DNA-directed RNA polymerase subunit beta' [Chloroflexi bacterium]|nr:DNA-directed RNA polymerase subunit beta' [Chloroflexota bacterium]
MPEREDFTALRISIASPEEIRRWSYGEVNKPETINYRTLKPERDGLFCERIFGPTKDFECYCGKYKRMRYQGIRCDRCGVEVARSKVRRERMGHIELASPVAHIWFVKGTPSWLGLLLDLSPRTLERVLYFADYVVTDVDEEARNKLVEALKAEATREVEGGEARLQERIRQIRGQAETELAAVGASGGEDSEAKSDGRRRHAHSEAETLEHQWAKEKEAKAQELEQSLEQLSHLAPRQVLGEAQYRSMIAHFPGIFKAGMGAEAVLAILRRVNLDQARVDLYQELNTASGQRRKKAIKRLRVIEGLRRSGNKPEWMVLTVLPVLPPDLRPMVQLDGGRFATSDLNDLYRRVINRNNRLRRLLEVGASDIIVRNEKRMLQEAVDALIDNSKRGRALTTNNHRLKSLSDLLRGKRGRFRQNLLGKRMDYSGRTVIVVGPELKLDQCGLPRRMALELFKPFVMHKLITLAHAHNIKGAKRLVERARPEVWDVLEDVVRNRLVLLNRAPTLHRLGIQAFRPVLINGSAIQIHPLVCSAYNADFDGDQMAVHVPLSRAALAEAEQVMLSVWNMLSPASGEPLTAPTLDMVLGCYYLTLERPGSKGEGKQFANFFEAKMAYNVGAVSHQALIEVRNPRTGERVKTTVGRILFNDVLPPDLDFRNTVMDKKRLKELTAECHRHLGPETTARMLDAVKRLGFHFATVSGMSIAVHDLDAPRDKQKILAEAEEQVAQVERQFLRGLATEEELREATVDIWRKATERMKEAVEGSIDRYGSLYMMATSGTKGNISQITQMAGMRGLMSDPSGRIIDLPIKSSFQEGLTALEYFISTHGARKGLADTALRTADSGYLTRRLVDVAQEVIVLEEDCHTSAGVYVSGDPREPLLGTTSRRAVGRYTASPVVDPRTGEVILDANREIEEDVERKIREADEYLRQTKNESFRLHVRSPLTCEARRGICRMCYGRSPARGRLVEIGEASGVIAAQSIGEPGTQLTMRTFHTGGVAGVDITSGLPRVEELFEARSPKGKAVISEIDGQVEVLSTPDGRRVKVVSSEVYRDEYALPSGYAAVAPADQWVDAGKVLAQPTEAEGAVAGPLVARMGGWLRHEDNRLVVHYEEKEEREYHVPASAHIVVENGVRVRAGDRLTEGPLDPQDILRISGREAVQRYLVDEIQKVYAAQGVAINDKHIETIIRQMLRRVRVDAPGDTGLLPGVLVDRYSFETINNKVLAEGGEPATAQEVLLGITKASLNTESFLAKASFQETTRVLTEAALFGSVDKLSGLKENVIIGRLIPARATVKLPEPRFEENVIAVAAEAFPALEAFRGEDLEGDLAPAVISDEE